MDVEHSLKELKQTADATVLNKLVFTAEMEEQVRRRISKGKREAWHIRKMWWAVCSLLAAVAIVWLGAQSMLPNETTGQQGIAAWQPSPLYETRFEGKPFHYYGEKPVRIITGDLHEDHGQKVMWLLNGAIPSEVEIIAASQQGEELELGSWPVGGAMYDADAHFPSSITLPAPGVWKLTVVGEGTPLGEIYVQVLEGYPPAIGEAMETLIQEYLESTGPFAEMGQRYASLHIIGIDGANALEKTVYAWAVVESFEEGEKGLQTKAGFSGPMTFIVRYQTDDYRVAEYQLPADGNQYWPSIERMFPPKYVSKLQALTQTAEQHNQLVQRLTEANRSKAQAEQKNSTP